MKVGLYLQDLNYDKKMPDIFNEDMEKVKNTNIDIFVLPEHCYTPFVEEVKKLSILSTKDKAIIIEKCKKLSDYLGCALIFSSKDRDDIIYSLYINPYASNNETFSKTYYKHTMTHKSAFDLNDYQNQINELFTPIIYKNLKIGITICYDCNHSIFSRTYGINGIDILINSTGGNIVYDKWFRYNKARSIENNCFNFCTMGYSGDYIERNSYVLGFTPKGKSLPYTNLTYNYKSRNIIGSIYIFDTENDDGSYGVHKSINQTEKTNRFQHLYFPCNKSEEIISKSIQIFDNIFCYNSDKKNIIIIVLEEFDVLKPEKVLYLMYHNALKNIKNKRYIILNKWNDLEKHIYEGQISDILKVRSMENYCAVVLESNQYNKCYQCGKNRTAQVVKGIDGKFGIDLDRTKGPETIWKDKKGMKAKWRKGFEDLINEII